MTSLQKKIIEQRLEHAQYAADMAMAHGLDTANGRRLLEESAQWVSAASNAEHGNLAPVRIH